LAVGAIVLALILIPFFLFGEALAAWVDTQLRSPNKWFLGSFIVLLLASDVFLPVPSSIVSTSAGLLLGFAVGMFVSTLGMCAGAILGYVMGRTAGKRILQRAMSEKELARASGLIYRYGSLAVILSRPIPVLAETGVVAAGIAKMPFSKFLVASALSNLGVSAAYAAVGAYSHETGSFLLAFAGAIGVPALAMGLNRIFGSRDQLRKG
jgi:uncharacterized membrane protein YdjX (TVP38/TMEM64 family)